MPIYNFESPIAIHPALGVHKILVDKHSQPFTTIVHFGVYEAAYPGMEKLKAQFATGPSVQHLRVYFNVSASSHGAPSLYRQVHSNNGVRIGHLLKACAALLY
jgi:hypothetical protein